MRISFLAITAITVALFVLGVSPLHAAGVVRVTMHDGVVSVSAKGATLNEILDAWARTGQTEFVNVDKITTTAPLTLELTDVGEKDALDVLLNSLGGYLGVARPAGSPNESRFARVVIATSIAPATTTAVLNTTPPAPVAPPPQQSVIVNGVARLIGPGGALVEDDQEGAPPSVPRPVAPAPAPPSQPPSTSAPGVVGSAAPGIIVPPPQKTPAPAATPQR